MNKIIKSIGFIFSLSIPLGCIGALAVSTQDNHSVNNVVSNATTGPSALSSISPSTTTATSIYEFTTSNWNATKVATDFPDRFASTIESSPADKTKLKGDIIVPSGFSSYTPIITVKADDAGDAANKAGTIYVRYDYSASGLPSAALPYQVQSHVYNSFNYLPDYTWSIDASSINRNQLASNLKASDVKLIESPKMKTIAHTTAIAGIDDGDGTLTITVKYPSLPNIVNLNHKQLTITDFYHTSDFAIKSWGTLSPAQLAVAPTEVTQADVLSWVDVQNNDANKPIKLNAGLIGVTPTVDLSSTKVQNNMTGYLYVGLTFTDPSIIRGGVTFTKQIPNFFNQANYSITVDTSKVNRDKLAKDAKPSDFTNAIVPSPALLKYGGSPTISIHGADDTKGTLEVYCHYPNLINTIPILDYSYKVTGYDDGSFVFQKFDNKKKLMPTEIEKEINTDGSDWQSVAFVDSNRTDARYSPYIFSAKYPNGIKPTVLKGGANNDKGTLTITYDFSKISALPISLRVVQTHEYSGLPTPTIVANDIPPKKNDKANYDINGSDINGDNVANYIIVDKDTEARMEQQGYKISYDIVLNKNGSVSVTVVYTNAAHKEIKCAPVVLDGFKTNAPWIAQNWWIILVIAAAVIAVLILLMFLVKQRKKRKLNEKTTKNKIDKSKK